MYVYTRNVYKITELIKAQDVYVYACCEFDGTAHSSPLRNTLPVASMVCRPWYPVVDAWSALLACSIDHGMSQSGCRHLLSAMAIISARVKRRKGATVHTAANVPLLCLVSGVRLFIERAPPMPPTPGRAGGSGAEFHDFCLGILGCWHFCVKTIF